MKIVVAVLLLAAIVSARPSRSSSPACVSPKQFVGDYGVYIHTHDNNTRQNGTMYYDGNEERIRVDVVVKGVMYKVVQIYKEKVQYVMFTYKGKPMCIIQDWTAPFHPIELPPDALELEHGRIGTAEHGLDIRRFYGYTDGAEYVGTVTADECVLTSSVSRIPKKMIAFFSLTNVSRLSTTDADFEHPSDCKHVPGRHDSPDFNLI